MRDYHINICYSEKDNAYIANIPDLEACSVLGATPDDALREVLRVKQLRLEAAKTGKVQASSELKMYHVISFCPALKSGVA